ncbi:MAG: IS6 family transposase [Dehalococcoidia bacterium]|nr:IS6 family transposase [Dehalococcoidia bacterium]
MVSRYVLAEDFKCKYCGSNNLWLYCRYKGSQRFYCRDCKRKFAGNFALPKMRSPVRHVGDALQSYFSGMSLNEVRQNIEQQHSYSPSVSTIYRWLNRFIREAEHKVRDTRPNVGDTWIADETVIKINGKKYWLFDCIDADTRFLLASHLSPNRGTREARALMEKAAERAGKAPKVVMTDKLAAYLDGIELAFGADSEHKQGSPFDVQANTNLIERFQGTLKDRTKVLRGLKRPDTAHRFIEGWLIHYNYFRPHTSLKGKTPAEKAGVRLSVNDWLDVVRQPTDTATIDLATEPRPILRLHHPKPSPPALPPMWM